jgi:putative ABC transport system ATP-binding protein
MAESRLVRATELTKVFGAGVTQVRAVEGVSLEIGRGEIVLVMGPSGSGKTTLLSIIGGLLRPTSGRVELDGTEILALGDARLAELRARKIGFVFQAFNLLASLTVEENVLFPAGLLPGPMGKARERALTLLDRVGLGGRRRFFPRSLSGGEKQRVAVARALINDPPLVLADEPTGNLDSGHGQAVLMMLHDIARDEGRSVVIVTHDPRVEEVADRVLWLEDGALRDRKTEPHSWVRDPVCGMRVDEWTAEAVAEHAGQRVVFCSFRCLERFREEPDRYTVGG